MKGCYCLIIHLNQANEIKIGKRLGKINFKKGYYVYVGSAMNSLESRLNRHLSDEKKLHWHIDYLLKKGKITEIIYNKNKKVECELSQYLSTQAEGIRDFGCSDCDCESHLYYFKTKNEAIECVENAYDSIAMDYEFFRK
ncbi:MAG: GIY-YIG nuclease family protein [Methanobrevibacter sp.]|uniref:GIY-YIG nuclease family protein n=1 Tax=Methanobrevibacter sp. TaxID=66852 RepID=UPI0025DB8D61|nr:GIY-YIG nuclease family protein [Methanobrevibacter sp.]MBQ6099531.1 GIY-YIG nuclease family protein [Methanobrevibacter sp.]